MNKKKVICKTMKKQTNKKNLLKFLIYTQKSVRFHLLRCVFLWGNRFGKKSKKWVKRKTRFCSKMGLLNSPSHRHTKSIAMHGAIATERDPDTSWVSPSHQVSEKMPTLKWVEGPNHTHHKPHPSTIRKELTTLVFPWRAKELDPISSTLTFKTPPEK